MTYDSERHHRRSIRLKDWDYTRSSAYYVTANVQGRWQIFGRVVDSKMQLSEYGEIVRDTWEWLASQYQYVNLDEYVVMPDHFHGILWLCESGGPGVHIKPVGGLVGAFKTVCTKHINLKRGTAGSRLWQRDFWEHIGRNDADLERIRAYIRNNPARWWEKKVLSADIPPE